MARGYRFQAPRNARGNYRCRLPGAPARDLSAEEVEALRPDVQDALNKAKCGGKRMYVLAGSKKKDGDDDGERDADNDDVAGDAHGDGDEDANDDGVADAVLAPLAGETDNNAADLAN